MNQIKSQIQYRVSPRKCVSQGGEGGGGALAIVDGGGGVRSRLLTGGGASPATGGGGVGVTAIAPVLFADW